VSRLAHVAEDLGNLGMAGRLKAVIQDQGDDFHGRARTGALVVPVVVRSRPAGSPAYLTRFRTQLDTVREHLVAAHLPASPKLSLAVRRSFAQDAKRDDVYHSTTIEGYRVTPDDMEAVFSGRPVQGTTPEEAERRFALLGYANAFDVVLKRFSDALTPLNLTLDVVFDLHEALWYPSVDAGILPAQALREVRNSPVYLWDSRFVPPPPEKARPMLETLGDYSRSTSMSGAERAGVLHWGFESIHPFRDGNGRVGRLLMNLALGDEGYPWVTIRAEDRSVYFRALEQGQVYDNGIPWAVFLRQSIESAIRRAEAQASTAK
jgi:Fic family protein